MAALAARQHGAITTAQLRKCRLTATMINRRVAAGRLHPVHFRVYAVGHAALSPAGELMALVLACGDGALLTGEAALHLQGYMRWRPRTTALVTPKRRTPPAPHVTVRLTGTLVPADRATHDGIPITSVPRSLLEMAETCTHGQVARVLHEVAFKLRGLPHEALADVLRRAAGRHAGAVLAEAIRQHEIGSAGTRSSLEDEALAAVLAAGAPAPLVNVHAATLGGSHEVDLHWPAARLVVEVDGSPHGRAHTKAQDATRQKELEAAGWRVVRCRPREITRVAREVARLLAGAAG